MKIPEIESCRQLSNSLIVPVSVRYLCLSISPPAALKTPRSVAPTLFSGVLPILPTHAASSLHLPPAGVEPHCRTVQAGCLLTCSP